MSEGKYKIALVLDGEETEAFGEFHLYVSLECIDQLTDAYRAGRIGVKLYEVTETKEPVT